ncbi:hypothetical protein MGN70_014301 [Eutypa lata]|nr:hypothetical protein MGN70_014301 [Eutypa lata]
MSVPLVFPQAEAERLEPHLPPPLSEGSSSIHGNNGARPFVTLTFATSLDSALSLGPGIRTALSGPQSKAMTHYLRSRHDAICVGVGTAIADDPGLNCRIAPEAVAAAASTTNHVPMSAAVINSNAAATPTFDMTGQPRPIVIDPLLRWDFTSQSKVMQLARAGQGLAPYIITAVTDPPVDKRSLLEGHGGKFIVVEPSGREKKEEEEGEEGRRHFEWRAILAAVRAEGLRSIMVEGGGAVINSLLSPGNTELIDEVIVTIAPTWLGQGGVVVSPPRKLLLPTPGEGKGEGQGGQEGARPGPAVRLTDTMWMPLGEDVVLCGRIAE